MANTGIPQQENHRTKREKNGLTPNILWICFSQSQHPVEKARKLLKFVATSPRLTTLGQIAEQAP